MRFLAPALVALILLSACQVSPHDWVFERTGEEKLLGQLRGILQRATDFLHPQVDTADYAPMPHAGVNPFGVNVFLNQEVEEEKRDRSLQMIADAGFGWIRQEFPWEDIEVHGKGDFVDRRNDLDGDGEIDPVDAWAKYDNIVDLAERHNLSISVRLSNPPAWTRELTDTVGTYAPPDDLSDWGDYVYAVVSRYRGRIRYYQLWNEPNVYPEWGEQPVDPEGYTELLCEGYRRAKEANPEAVIISGALAPTVSLHPGPGPALGMNEFVFLQGMYDAGAAECFDILSVNDYMLWSGPTDRRMRPLNINFSRPRYVRDIMVANGDAGKAIWIGEMNSNAVPDDPNIVGLGDYGQVTLEEQARYAPLAYQRIMQDWPWVGVANFWFFKRADDSEANQAMYYFRMVEPDFTPMPVYGAMRQYATNVTPTLYPGTHQEDHWALTYDGGWESAGDETAAMGRYRRATAAGATLRFAFDGASLQLLPGPGSGEVEVSLDGEAPRRVSLEGQAVRLRGGWRRGRHEVVLRAAGGQVGVDQLVVRRAWRPSRGLILGVVGSALAVAWVLGCVLRRK
ncbi:MAG: hypothetical protein U9R72_05220 [Chloroflexota bacterium]|nr:hypothetical protein [Chloroflexota bacterium]